MGQEARIHVGAASGAGLLLAGLLVAAFCAMQIRGPRASAPPLAREPALASPSLQVPQDRQLRFERNQGQAPQDVRYLSRGPRHQLSVFDDGLALSTPTADGTPSSARLRFLGARRSGHFEEREPVATRAHYLHGADPARWIRDVHQARQLRYAELYRGIDLVYYSRDGELEFDLVVRPGADPGLIHLQASGAKAPHIDADGHLLLDGEDGVLRVHRPVLQQNINGQRITLDARWVLGNDGSLRFDLPVYDKRHPLVIDPVFKLLYSTYLGGVHDDVVGGMVLDTSGNAYVVGHSGSEDWPVSGNAVQTSRKNLGVYVRNVVVTKFDAAGTLVWSTFLGGGVNDYGRGIALDAQGRVVIAGQTLSSDFPTTAGGYQRQLQGSANAFVAVLSPDGSTLEYASLYGGAGGSDATGLKIDPAGRVMIAGSAGPGLPTTAGAYQTTLPDGSAAFVAKFDLTLAGAAQLAAASYYGAAARPAGQNNDNFSYAFALDATGAPWLTGQSFTRGLPVTPDAVMAAPASLTSNCQSGSVPLNSAGYVAKLSGDLKNLQYASYLTGRTGGPGTCSEFGRSIALDDAGSVYVAGSTASLSFPTTPGAFQVTSPANAGVSGYAGFVVKLAPDGRSITWSTYLGGDGGNMFFSGIVVDGAANAVWLHGTTGGGTNFPLSADGLQRSFGGGSYDAAVHQLDATTGALKYGSFLGGAGNDDAPALALDSGGNAYIAGHTDSRNLAVTPTAFQPAYTADAFDGNDWFFRVIGSGVLSRVRPRTGGNGGDVTLSIDGVGLQPGALCALSNGLARVEGHNTLVAADGTAATCTVTLVGVGPGVYDVSIANPDGTVLKRPGAFTVATGGSSVIEVDIIGSPVLRTGVPSDYQVTVRNTGTVDAYMVPVWLSMSTHLRYAIQVVTDDPATAAVTLDDGAGLYDNADPAQAAERRRVPFILPRVAAGGAVTLRLRASNPVSGDDFTIAIEPELPWYETRQETLDALARYRDSATLVPSGCVDAPGRPTVSDCFGLWSELMGRVLAKVVPGLPPGPDGLALSEAQAALRLQQVLATTLAAAIDPPAASGTSSIGRRAHATAAVAGEGRRIRPLALTPAEVVGGLVVGAVLYEAQWGALVFGGGDMCTVLASRKVPPVIAYSVKPPSWDLETCKKGQSTRKLKLTYHCQPNDIVYEDDVKCPPEPDPDKNKNKKKNKKGSIKDAKDPNDKYGPEGGGGAIHAVATLAPFTYQIAFENQATAGLAAAEVVVTDRLDADRFDLSTLTLGSISWGPHRVDVPPGLNSFATVFNIDDTIAVRVAGSLNPTTGVLKWTLTTLDPATHLPPSDPTLGFLPPNIDGTQGQGYVNFTIHPKAGLPDGSRWENSASIVFDANAPIQTPTWVNTLDTTAPVGRVTSATQRSGSTDVDVAWEASDAGSGARSYTVYVSDNGGAYTAWQSGVSLTSAVWPGTAGHAYGFHVIATDGAGNIEAAKSVAEASVTVRDPVAGGAGGGGCTVGGRDHRDATLVLLACAAAVLRRRRRLSAPTANR